MISAEDHATHLRELRILGLDQTAAAYEALLLEVIDLRALLIKQAPALKAEADANAEAVAAEARANAERAVLVKPGGAA